MALKMVQKGTKCYGKHLNDKVINAGKFNMIQIEFLGKLSIKKINICCKFYIYFVEKKSKLTAMLYFIEIFNIPGILFQKVAGIA